MNDKTTARKMVLVSTALLVALAFYRGAKDEQGVATFKRVWAAGVVGLFLSITADFAPQIAGPMGVLAVLGSLTRGGDKALQNALGGIASKAPAPASTNAGSSPAHTGG
jgi:hypothetical protein